MRRLYTYVMLGAIVVLTTLVSVPSTAHAFAPEPSCPVLNQADYQPQYGCNVRLDRLTYFKGWATVEHDWCSKVYYAAWRWNGRWTRTWISERTRVYVWPYTVDWSWVWTAETGWLAMRDANIRVNAAHWGIVPMCVENPTPVYRS